MNLQTHCHFMQRIVEEVGFVLSQGDDIQTFSWSKSVIDSLMGGFHIADTKTGDFFIYPSVQGSQNLRLSWSGL